MKQTKLMLGDNIESLKKLPDNSIDSIVTDPPYGLSFMGKKWDYDVPSVEFWKEVYRVLKPGGHILSFGGTRTYHRMVVNIEDAGFEIRDQVMWLYGSGFPKSHNIGKAVDKIEGNEREVVGLLENYQNKNGVNAVFSTEKVIDENRDRIDIPLTKGQSKYEGWGTALKPANEPICVARKPLSEKTIADNVIKWGTGGINIDGCRVATDDKLGREFKVGGQTLGAGQYGLNDGRKTKPTNNLEGTYHDDTKGLGRFPANIILDETAAELLDEQSGNIKSTKYKEGYKGGFGAETNSYINHKPGGSIVKNERGYNDNGGASRFFYVAKVSKKERNLGLDGFECEIKLTPTIKLIVKTDYNNKNLLWEKQDLKTTHVDTDKLHQKDTEEYGALLNEDKLWNTDMYGNYIMEQFQKDFKSIIEMEINSTTIYQILNSSIQKNTKTYIQELYGEMVKDINFVENVEKKSTKMTFTLQEEKTDGYTANVKSVLLKGMWSISVKENKCSHPTLKPINLMTYLCRLVTPEGGIVLDPFMGSGSTGISALLEGFRFVGMEMDKEYFKIAEARIEAYEEYRKLIK